MRVSSRMLSQMCSLYRYRYRKGWRKVVTFAQGWAVYIDVEWRVEMKQRTSFLTEKKKI